MFHRFVRWFDHRLSDSYHIYLFNDSPECILRLQNTRARHDMHLGHITVNKDDPVLGIHLWAEHLPPMAVNSIRQRSLPASSDFSWAVTTQRRFVGSLRFLMAYLSKDSRIGENKAIFGITSLFNPERGPGGIHPMERLGFTIIPYHGKLGAFGEFWENFYALALIWAYHPASAAGRSVCDLKRTEMWMSIDTLKARYGIN